MAKMAAIAYEKVEGSVRVVVVPFFLRVSPRSDSSSILKLVIALCAHLRPYKYP